MVPQAGFEPTTDPVFGRAFSQIELLRHIWRMCRDLDAETTCLRGKSANLIAVTSTRLMGPPVRIELTLEASQAPELPLFYGGFPIQRNQIKFRMRAHRAW